MKDKKWRMGRKRKQERNDEYNPEQPTKVKVGMHTHKRLKEGQRRSSVHTPTTTCCQLRTYNHMLGWLVQPPGSRTIVVLHH
jgi:hypothetical protein